MPSRLVLASPFSLWLSVLLVFPFGLSVWSLRLVLHLVLHLVSPFAFPFGAQTRFGWILCLRFSQSSLFNALRASLAASSCARNFACQIEPLCAFDTFPSQSGRCAEFKIQNLKQNLQVPMCAIREVHTRIVSKIFVKSPVKPAIVRVNGEMDLASCVWWVAFGELYLSSILHRWRTKVPSERLLIERTFCAFDDRLWAPFAKSKRMQLR